MKSPYPSTQDPKYAAVLQRQVADLSSSGSEALSLLDEGWLRDALAKDPANIDTPTRYAFERALDLAAWFDIHRPTIKL